MAQDYAASMQGVAIRLTRLNADGTTQVGASASYVTNQFVSVAFTPQYVTGDEYTQKAADGTVCADYQAPDSLKNATIEIAICNPDPEFTEMLCGGTVFVSGGLSVGYASALVGIDPNPNAVAVEVWSKTLQSGKIAGNNPYWHWIFPYVKVTPSGDRTIEGGLLANAFSGTTVGNSAFGDGPKGDWPFTSTSPYQYARTATAPTGLNGYQAAS